MEAVEVADPHQDISIELNTYNSLGVYHRAQVE